MSTTAASKASPSVRCTTWTTPKPRSRRAVPPLTQYLGIGCILGADERTPIMRVSDVARAAAVNIQTLRYYERRGLLPDPSRRPSGYREYEPETVQRVRFIKRAQELGF